MAVGWYYTDPRGVPTFTVAERWNGTTWRMVTIGGPPGLIDLSCHPGTSACLAIGAGQTQTWNGTGWQLVMGTGSRGLVSVSCRCAGNCIAVGQAGSLTLARRWDGARWRSLTTLSP